MWLLFELNTLPDSTVLNTHILPLKSRNRSEFKTIIPDVVLTFSAPASASVSPPPPSRFLRLRHPRLTKADVCPSSQRLVDVCVRPETRPSRLLFTHVCTVTTVSLEQSNSQQRSSSKLGTKSCVFEDETEGLDQGWDL